MADNLSAAIINATPKAADEINDLQVLLVIPNNLVSNTVNKYITAIISICPASMPKLNDNSGEVIFAVLPNKDLSKTEKPSPWMIPKKTTIIIFTHRFLFPPDLSAIKLLKAVNIIVQGIRNSTNAVFTFTRFNTLKTSVIECPIVNALTSINIFFQSLGAYPARRTHKNRIWSWAFKSAICHNPSVNQIEKSFNA